MFFVLLGICVVYMVWKEVERKCMNGATRDGNSTVASFVMQRFIIHLFI